MVPPDRLVPQIGGVLRSENSQRPTCWGVGPQGSFRTDGEGQVKTVDDIGLMV